jgi:F-type H+-transporting ATPase subunit a
MLLLTASAWAIARRLRVDRPGLLQSAAEGIVLAISKAVDDVVPDRGAELLPFIGTLWLLIAAANLAGVVPGVQSPTGDLSTTSALALIVFLSVHWFGIRNEGLRAYLRHYLSPSPILLPFHLISELTRTVALAVRLFGNIMSLEMAALLVLLVAGFLVPVPLLMLHIVEALVQAYIFGMLALVYIGGALEVRESHSESDKGDNAI